MSTGSPRSNRPRSRRSRSTTRARARGSRSVSGATAATTSATGAATVPRPRRSSRSRSTDPAAARRSLAYAIARRGLPLPNAVDPERRTAWGWTGDARSLVEPTARVLLAVNVLTPRDTATRREAVGLLTTRQCADGGWNFGNASVYDVDLRGYAQTDGDGADRAPKGARNRRLARRSRFLRSNWRLEPGGLTVAQALVAYRLHGRRDELPPLLAALGEISRRPVVPGAAACGRLGDARHRAGRAARTAEVARVSMTRRQLLVRGGRSRALGERRGRDRRRADRRVRPRRRFDRADFPEAGSLQPWPSSAPGRTRATSKGCSWTACGSSSADVRRKTLLLKPNLVEFVRGSVDQHRPADGRRGRERAPFASAPRRSSSRRGRGIAATPRRSRWRPAYVTRSTTPVFGSSTSTMRRSYGRRSARATPGSARSGCRRCCATRRSSCRCRSSRRTTGSASRCR